MAEVGEGCPLCHDLSLLHVDSGRRDVCGPLFSLGSKYAVREHYRLRKFNNIIDNDFLLSGSSILVIAGWPVLLGYGQLYGALLSNFPQSFTLGEASVIAQGLVLFLVNALILHLPRAVSYPVSFSAESLHCLTLIIENGVLWILLLILVLKFGHKLFKNVIVFGILFGCTVLGISLSPITDPVPLHCIIDFILQDQERVRNSLH